VAVAQVTLNRSKHPNFPNDICQVVYQKTIFMEKVVCQFSWYCENGGRPKIKHPELYKESYEVAKKVLLENFRLPSMKDAMYFHAVYVNPNWGKERIGVIGNHIFYRDRNVKS
jgi:spore germination cell wall hydrolase CwlJ-like protein